MTLDEFYKQGYSVILDKIVRTQVPIMVDKLAKDPALSIESFINDNDIEEIDDFQYPSHYYRVYDKDLIEVTTESLHSKSELLRFIKKL